MNYAFEEYKLLQEKTDKIGAFRFTIKGWSVTALVGGLVAISADHGASPWKVAAILSVCLSWFFVFERQQVKLSWKFAIRSMEIEDEIDRIRQSNKWVSRFAAPLIANKVSSRSDRTKRRRRPRPRNFRRLRQEALLWWKSDALFYAVLIGISWAPGIIGAQSQSTPQSIIVSGDTIMQQAIPRPDQNSNAPRSPTKKKSEQTKTQAKPVPST